MKDRIRYIDFEKGILILIVLYIHLTFQYNRVIELSMLHRLCIPQFALIAGYNIGFALNKPMSKVLLKTISKMFFIYFISLIFTQIIFTNNFNLREALTIMMTGGVIINFNIPIWYVPHYISLFIISFSLVKVASIISSVENKINSKNRFSYIFLIIMSIALSILGFNYAGENYFFIKQSLILIPLTVLGFIIYKLDLKCRDMEENLDEVRKGVLYTVILITFIVCAIIFIITSIVDEKIDLFPFIFNSKILFYVSTITGGIALFILCKMITKVIFFDFLTNIISYIGKKSIYICCLHQPLQIVFLPFYKSLYEKFAEGSFISVLIQIIISVYVSIVVSYVFERDN